MRGFFKLIALIVAAWVGGFFYFVGSIPTEAPAELDNTDAIVVLTGGSGRVETGFKLLADQKAQKLFISGVGKGVRKGDITALVPGCCTESDVIYLGHDANDTEGNARETAVWMQKEGFRSLRLVTGNYHLPRSLSVFSDAMPDIRVVPYPVISEQVHVERWWRYEGTFKLLAAEYHKFLGAKLKRLAQ